MKSVLYCRYDVPRNDVGGKPSTFVNELCYKLPTSGIVQLKTSIGFTTMAR